MIIKTQQLTQFNIKMNQEDFTKFILKLREKKIRQKQFAKWLGYRQQTLIVFKQGKRPVPLILSRACEYLTMLENSGVDIKKKINEDLK